MNELTVTGKVAYINPTESKASGDKTYFSRTFGLDLTQNINGSEYKNHASFQMGNQERAAWLDTVALGDTIAIKYALRGNYKEYPDKVGTEKNPKAAGIFTVLNVYEMQVVNRANGAATNNAAGNNHFGTSGTNNAAATENADDLPF